MQQNQEQPEGKKPRKPEEQNKDPTPSPEIIIVKTEAGNLVQHATTTTVVRIETVKKIPWRQSDWYLTAKKVYPILKDLVTIWIPSAWWLSVTFFREYIPVWLARILHLH